MRALSFKEKKMQRVESKKEAFYASLGEPVKKMYQRSARFSSWNTYLSQFPSGRTGIWVMADNPPVSVGYEKSKR